MLAIKDGKRIRGASPIELLSSHDKQLLAEAKRFYEWYEGCKEFRDQCREGVISERYCAKLSDLGVSETTISSMLLLWSDKLIFELDLTGHTEYNQPLSEDPTILVTLSKNRALELFLKNLSYNIVSKLKHFHYSLNKLDGSSSFFKWRQRRIRATRSELGSYAYALDHPSFSIELGVGCTVGCTFCAFDAEQLKSNFDYNIDTNKELFRAVAKAFVKVLGPASGSGMLYYATEPNDNPNYINFLQEWYDITGFKLCTSTARYDLDWIDNLIQFYKSPFPISWPRVSVLSKHIMERIHRHFTPVQLLYPWLLPQQIEVEDERAKVPGGREQFGLKALAKVKDCRDYDSLADFDYSQIPQGSIACVSGFKINMVLKTITATSPCFTSQHWTKGYRDFGTIQFTTPESVLPALEELISSCMPQELEDNHLMVWRDDLQYREQDTGFDLVSPTQYHKFRDHELYSYFGKLVSTNADSNPLTFLQVKESILQSTNQWDTFMLDVFIKKFFNSGFISESR
jgi:hypothetical protein